tara:strand:- start:308 stop:472 length:165 start_codon:yes stop_codon:yes gene_type:complete
MMIKKLFKIFKKPKPTLIWLHIEQRQYYGVIGWLANDRKTFVKGQDNFNRLGLK